MNASWLPGIATAIGVLINLVWTSVNMQMRTDLSRQISELKEWMGKEYVADKICTLRMANLDGTP